jgi:hypothetical protein
MIDDDALRILPLAMPADGSEWIPTTGRHRTTLAALVKDSSLLVEELYNSRLERSFVG